MLTNEFGIIKEYKLKNISFKTITIPKGTLLFRGIDLDENKHPSVLFNDLIGSPSGGRYSVAPSMNVFFYPVPYVSDAVNPYNVYGMYITQYNLELILLVKPAEIHRGDTEIINSPLVTCNRIAKYDKCGKILGDIDPCITEAVLKKYPYIGGYIAISKQDADVFFGKYKLLIENGEYEKAKHIIPSILTNSGGISGIPEIVLHPHYFRNMECYTYGKKLRTIQDIISACIHNRAQFSFFPLLYITNNGIYTFTDLYNESTITELIKSQRPYNGEKMPELHNKIERILSALLNTGYSINNIKYTAKIDNRTGFYVLLINTKKRNTYKNINRRTQLKDDGHKYIHTDISYKQNVLLNNIVNKNKYFNDLLAVLHINNYNLQQKYLFNKGELSDFIIKYHIDEVLDRPDLDKFTVKRAAIKNKTMKNIKNRFTYMNPNMDFDNINSIASNEFNS